MRAIYILFFFLVGNIWAKGQQVINSDNFDSFYQKIQESASGNPETSDDIINIKSTDTATLNGVQRAKLRFLRFLNTQAQDGYRQSAVTGLFSAPDSLNPIDSIIFVSNRYLERSMPDKAIPLLLKGIIDDTDSQEKADYCRVSLAEAYRQKREYEKGVALINEILSENGMVSDKIRSYAYNRLAALYNEWRNPDPGFSDSVFRYSELCIALSQPSDNKPNLAASQNELSLQYLRKKEYRIALELSDKAVTNFLMAGMPFHAMNALINQSNIYIAEKKYDQARKSVEDAISMSDIAQNRNLYMRLYFQLARIYHLKKEYKEAFELLRICYSLQSKFFNDRIDMQINEQSAKYDLLLKEQKIREEKEKNEYRRKENTFLIIVSLSLLIAFIVSLFYYRLRKQEILRRKLLEAVTETETQERKRIARDLHDGLGPVLSAINHYFQAFLDARPEEKEFIRGKLQQVISDAIEEVSRISHNISPHVLEQYGLITALQNFIIPLEKNNQVKIHFRSDLSERMDLKKELTIYRCITELLNNTMKHAGATEISINLSRMDSILRVQYADNGVGFTPGNQQPGGMGLSNIRHRIGSQSGSFTIESTEGKGMHAKMEIPV